MAKIYPKDGKWYANYKDALKDKWRGKLCLGQSGPLEATEGNRAQAQAFADALEAFTVEKNSTGDLTLDQWVEEFLNEREKLNGLASAQDIKSRYETHLKKRFGHLFLAEMSKNHVWPFVHELKIKVAEKKISASTARNAYFALAAILREAWCKHPSIIQSAFWDLPKRMLPPPKKSEPNPFSDSEINAILTCEGIPQDRRVLYALSFMAGARSGEASALRWSSITPKKPLAELRLDDGSRRVNVNGTWKVIQKGETKTGQVKLVPIIEPLGAILDEWFTTGFSKMFKRAPTPQDFIVPRLQTKFKGKRNQPPMIVARPADSITDEFYKDLAAAKIPRLGRVFHATRTTFISLLEKCGADPVVTNGFTHETKRTKDGASRTAREVYTHIEWAHACGEIAKWRLSLDTPTPPVAVASPTLAAALPVVKSEPVYYQLTTSTEKAKERESLKLEKLNRISELANSAGVAQLVEQRFCNSLDLLPATPKQIETLTISSPLAEAKPSESALTRSELTTVTTVVVSGTYASEPTVEPLEPLSLWDIMGDLQPGWHQLHAPKSEGRG